MSKLSSQTIRFILLIFGVFLLVLGVRHFDFFGFRILNILCIITGFFLLVLSIQEKRLKNEKM
jgi:membrane-bound ClpP family serine protease